MNTHRWILTHIITLLGITGGLDHVLLTPAHAESFNVKSGVWEMITTITSSSSKLSPEMSGKMTPAQRAKMEQMLKAREGKPMTVTDRSCLTKEDISYDRIIKEMEDADDDEEVKCTIKVISKSSSKMVLDQVCPAPRSSTTHWMIEAKTTESLVGSGERDQPGVGKSRMEMKGKWLSASCDELEE